MLNRLSIRNYALIENLEIDFRSGLTVITGETGAGKSILLGAFSHILGQRADVQSILNKSDKCIVEAEFDLTDTNPEYFFEHHNFDYEEKTIIRREINRDGKSRAFINDTPATLSQLKELGLLLVDVHSQHETLALNSKLFQLSIVDAFAGNRTILARYSGLYRQYSELKSNLDTLIQNEQRAKSELDYHTFLFEELEKAELKAGEQELLEQELETLSYADKIRTNLSSATAELSGNQGNIISRLSSLTPLLRSTAKYFPKLEEITTRLESTEIELKDLADELEKLEHQISSNPQRIVLINERLSEIFSLQSKHRVKTVDELIILKNSISQRISVTNSLSEQIQLLETEKNILRNTLSGLASELSSNREKVISKIEKEIIKMLGSLGMPGAVLKISFSPQDELSPTGRDTLNFLFSANKGIPPNDLSRVASGGELSRLMLCLKTLVAKKIALPTMVFDEIDSGISGEIALRAGEMLQKISEEQQVICITHLPQIASKGKNHYLVYKDSSKEQPNTMLRKLSDTERVEEIAKMISGEKPTSTALMNARELMKN